MIWKLEREAFVKITRAIHRTRLSLALAILTGAVQAAYPTPGAQEVAFEVHPTPMLNCQTVLESFLAGRPDGEFSLVADVRTSSIVAVGPPEIQQQLARFIELKISERMKRYVVDMQVTQMVQGRPREIHPPRQEVPYGKSGILNFDGNYHSGGADWRASLSVRPEPDGVGRIKLHIQASGHQGVREAVVSVKPGEDLIIDEKTGSLPGLRDLAHQLNSGSEANPYSVSLRVEPL